MCVYVCVCVCVYRKTGYKNTSTYLPSSVKRAFPLPRITFFSISLRLYNLNILLSEEAH